MESDVCNPDETCPLEHDYNPFRDIEYDDLTGKLVEFAICFFYYHHVVVL